MTVIMSRFNNKVIWFIVICKVIKAHRLMKVKLQERLYHLHKFIKLHDCNEIMTVELQELLYHMYMMQPCIKITQR